MALIQSHTNPRIQRIKKLLKSRKQNHFIVEGKKLLREAIQAGFHFDEIFITPEAWYEERQWMERLKDAQVLQVTPDVMKSISDVETPQGILGVAQKPKQPFNLAVQTFSLLLVSIRDPGNFGAIVRTAEACGCEWIGYTADSADPFQPKVVRSAMGSLFRVPLIEIHDSNSFLKEQISRNISTCGLETRGGQLLWQWKPRFPLIVCIGSESHGLPIDLPVTEKLTIPMKGSVESLNAAVAAAVCLYTISNFIEARK